MRRYKGDFMSGWDCIIRRLEIDLADLLNGHDFDEWDFGTWKIMYMKEKFGELRISWIGGEDLSKDDKIRIREAIEKAERVSWSICEVCGGEGRLRGKNWLKTLCEKHGDEYEAIGFNLSQWATEE